MADETMVTVVVNPPYDAVGVTTDSGPEYHTAADGEFEISQSEFDRLTDTKRMVDGPAVRRAGSAAPAPADSELVLTPGKNPTDEPTDPPEPHPSVAGEAPASPRLNTFEEGSNAWALYEGNTVPALQQLASDNDVEVAASANKADLVRALDEAGVSADGGQDVPPESEPA